jgi:outer membrane protein with beta-barrel domain
MKRLMGCLVAVVGLMVLVPERALAQEEKSTGAATAGEGSGMGGLRDAGPHTRGSMVSVFGLVPWGYGSGIGVAARYTLPIMNDGFISSINDSVELEFGGDIWFSGQNFGTVRYGYTGLAIPVEGRWSFHFNPKLSLYGKVSAGWYFNFWSDNVEGLNDLSYGGFYWNTGVGALYSINNTLWLRGEIGATGLKAGVGFNF